MGPRIPDAPVGPVFASPATDLLPDRCLCVHSVPFNAVPGVSFA